MKKLICFVLLLSLLPCLLLSGCGNSSERAWQAGQKALAEEKYDVAITSFQKAGSFQDAERLLLYAQASQDLATGNYENAEAGFRALGDFKDSLLMTDYCRARAQDAVAQAAFSSGDATGAVGAAMEGLMQGLPAYAFSNSYHGSYDVVERELSGVSTSSPRTMLPSSSRPNSNLVSAMMIPRERA